MVTRNVQKPACKPVAQIPAVAHSVAHFADKPAQNSPFRCSAVCRKSSIWIRWEYYLTNFKTAAFSHSATPGIDNNRWPRPSAGLEADCALRTQVYLQARFPKAPRHRDGLPSRLPQLRPHARPFGGVRDGSVLPVRRGVWRSGIAILNAGLRYGIIALWRHRERSPWRYRGSFSTRRNAPVARASPKQFVRDCN
jgi:hypothetical protein